MIFYPSNEEDTIKIDDKNTAIFDNYGNVHFWQENESGYIKKIFILEIEPFNSKSIYEFVLWSVKTGQKYDKIVILNRGQDIRKLQGWIESADIPITESFWEQLDAHLLAKRMAL